MIELVKKVPKGCVGCPLYGPLPDGLPCKNRRRGVGEIGICVFRPIKAADDPWSQMGTTKKGV